MSDLADFIAKYARPYDPATDTYRRPPFAAPIKAGKNTAIYNAHSYHTKVPPQGIEPYIAHYTDPGDLVLDPFCGSGMTGVAALKLGRRVILNDLSPAAIHIAYNYCTPVDAEALKREFERIQAAIREEFDWLYGTTCDRCGGPATIQYMIWSDVFECGRCNHEIVLWNAAVNPATGEVSADFDCSNCHARWQKTKLRRLRSQPVRTNYICLSCKPGRHERPVTAEEIQKISATDGTPIPYWYPRTQISSGSEMYIRSALQLRGVETVADLYTCRNLRGFALLWHHITKPWDDEIKHKLKFMMTGSVPSLTAMTLYTPNRAGRSYRKGTLYIPSLTIEQNVLGVVNRRFNRVLEYLKEAPTGDVATVVGHAGKLTSVGDATIDYVFTDPPFGSNIFYSDLNMLWESWLNDFTDDRCEAVVNKSKKYGKSVDDYSRLMTESFVEICRVLKPMRWASIVFHNSDDKIWQVILDAVNAAGLELVEINSFDKEQLSFKGIRGAKGLERVTNKDIVLNLRKPDTRVSPPVGGSSTARNGDAEVRVVQRIADYLSVNPDSVGRTLQHFWNVVLHEMLANGVVEVSMEHVGNMLPYYFKQVDGRWYLRGEAVLGGNVFELKTDAGALAWLTAALNAEPKTTGELIPQWQAATATLAGGEQEAGRLERLLEQNFWLDKRSGRWREPARTEREKMTAAQDLSAEAHLRVIRRFLAGESEHRPSSRELAAWVRFAYSREAFNEAVALYNHVDETGLDPEEAKVLRKMVAVCRLRAGQAPST